MEDLQIINKTNKSIEAGVLNPFPGLRPFTIDESHLYFGRDGQSNEVLYKLTENRFVAVIGASGTGKSSLMFCGLVPTLYGGFIQSAGSSWKVILTHPGNKPIENLADSIVKSESGIDTFDEDRYFKVALTASILKTSSMGLIEVAKYLNRKKRENILILVDQFEEIFRYKTRGNSDSINESHAFVKLLLNAIQQKEESVYVVITMRSDFIGECGQFQELTRLINESHYLVPQMTRDNFREAIMGPIAVAGGTISGSLISQLLNDIGEKPDQLPILQHALMRTWNYWVKYRIKDEPMDISHYDAIGRMDKALSDHANEAYEELSSVGKYICESIFKSLTEKGTDNRGIRQPASIKILSAISQSTPRDVIQVVDTFRMTGRSFLTPSPELPLDEDSIVDISHESLMRIWDKLVIWVEEESASIKLYLRLAEASERFQEGKSGLWKPPDLQIALNWQTKQNPSLAWAQRFDNAFERTIVFLNTSRQEYEAEEQNKIRIQKRALRRSRMVALFLGLATIVSLAFLLYSIVLQVESQKQEKLALEKSELAAISEKKALEQKKIAQEKERDAIEQKTLAQIQKDSAEYQKGLALQNLSEANRQRYIANVNLNEAKNQKKFAEVNEQKAIVQKNLADSNANRANLASQKAFALRMLSIAQSMAVKSIQQNKDKNEKSLLAYQAYIFNSKYHGSAFSNDIYNALYFSLKSWNEKPLYLFEGHKATIRSLEFIPGSEDFVSTGSDGKIFRWNKNNSGKAPIEIDASENINRKLVFDSKGENLFCISDGLSIRVYKGSGDMKYKTAFLAHNKKVNSISCSKSRNSLYSVSEDSTLKEWNTNNYSLVKSKNLGAIPVNIEASPNGNILAVSFSSGIVRILSANDFSTLKECFNDKGNIIYSLSFDPNSAMLSLGDKYGNVYIYDTNSENIIWQLSGQKARINVLKFSSNGKYLASGSFDGTVQVWNALDFTIQPLIFKDENQWVWTLSFTQDSKELISGYKDLMIKKWPLESAQLAGLICTQLKRNFTPLEWNRYVGADINYEKTCPALP